MVIVEKGKQGITIPNPRGKQITYSPNINKQYVDEKVNEEKQRAENVENNLFEEIGNLQTNLDYEINRASAVENTLFSELEEEKARAKNTEELLNDRKIDISEAYGSFVDFTTEQTIQATKTFKSGINMANTRINNLREPSNSGDAANKGYVDVVKAQVSSIEEKIPAQASSINQLADKDFVNSSIATNTANFIGTFESVAELEEYPTEELTNNDYAFVTEEDGVYARYKWNTVEWLFEYELNNSSFTQEQWDTINAGLTSGDTENLRDVVELVSDVVPEDASSTNKLVSTKFLEDRHVILPLLSLEATQEELEGVYNAISNAPQGSAFFISLPEGRGVMPVAIAIGGTSVFAQYSDGRYSHELKITLRVIPELGERFYLEKVDKTFATSSDLNDKQDTLIAGNGITIADDGKTISSNVFVARYGATSGEELEIAYQADKTVILDISPINPSSGTALCIRHYYWGSKNQYFVYEFVCITNVGYVYNITMTYNKDNGTTSWGWGNKELQSTDYRQTVITESNNNYPTSKAVVDYVKGAINVFVAKYGTTTFDEVTNAVNGGKAVLLYAVISGREFVLSMGQPDNIARYDFYGFLDIGTMMKISLDANSRWMSPGYWVNARSTDISTLQTKVGDLSQLETTDKTNIVNAINEVKQQGGGSASPYYDYSKEVTLGEEDDRVRVNIPIENCTEIYMRVDTLEEPISRNVAPIIQTDVNTSPQYFACPNGNMSVFEMNMKCTGYRPSIEEWITPVEANNPSRSYGIAINSYKVCVNMFDGAKYITHAGCYYAGGLPVGTKVYIYGKKA